MVSKLKSSLGIIIFIIIHVLTLTHLSELRKIPYGLGNLCQFAVSVSLVLIFNKIEKQPWGTLGFQKEKILKQLLVGIILFIVDSVPFFFINLLYWHFKGQAVVGLQNPGYFMIAYFFVFTGFGEEILFRGYILSRLKNLTGSKIAAIAVSAVLFGFAHVTAFNWDMLIKAVMIVGWAGVIAAFRMYVKDCSILSLMLAHGLHNIFFSSLDVV